MSGPKRNPDRLNTIGVVVVGICGAVLVYVTIVALQAFYVNDTSEIQTMADYGGQDTNVKSLRTEQINKITEYGTNPRPQPPKAGEPARAQSYRIPIDVAMKRVLEDAKTDPGTLVPTLGRSDKSTVLPIFGRPKTAPAAATPAAADAAAAAATAGAAAPTTPAAAPQAPTGAGTAPSPVNGAGPLDKPATPGTPGNSTGPAGKPPTGASAAGAATQAGAAAPGAVPAKGNGK